jgi:hypothetical protein
MKPVLWSPDHLFFSCGACILLQTWRFHFSRRHFLSEINFNAKPLSAPVGRHFSHPMQRMQP